MSYVQKWNLAVQYHLVDSVALAFSPALLAAPTPAALCFLSGNVLFCGGLYAGTYFEDRAYSRFTPIGGISFIAGWLLVALTGVRK